MRQYGTSTLIVKLTTRLCPRDPSVIAPVSEPVASHNHDIFYDPTIALQRTFCNQSRSLSTTKFEKPKEKSRNSLKESPERVRALVTDIGRKLGIPENSYSDWYKITLSQFIKQGGGTLLSLHNSSLANVLKKAYPEYAWDVSHFATKPRNYWKSLENQRKFVRRLEEILGITEGDYEAWYKVSTKEIAECGGRVLLNQYNSSILKLLQAVYPHVTWDPSRFRVMRRNYWKSGPNQRKFMESLGKKLGVREDHLEDWYNISSREVFKNGGVSIMASSDNSLFKLLRAAYPEHKWDVSRFGKRPNSYWASLENQRAFIEQVAEDLGFHKNDLDAWYKVPKSAVAKAGGLRLLSLYDSSLHSLLSTVYPEHPWDPLKFAKKPHKSWSSIENQKRFLTSIGEKLGIRDNLESWYHVTTADLTRHGAWSLLAHYYGGSISNLVTTVFPEHKWELWKFERSRQTIALQSASSLLIERELGS